MKYEITYKKVSEHTIEVEADSIIEAHDDFHKLSKSDLEETERMYIPNRKVTSVCEEEL